MNELEILYGGTEQIELPTNIGATVDELIGTFNESYLYMKARTLTGTCFVWSDTFIDKCRLAMSTDDMRSMGSHEVRAWDNFVSYQDSMTQDLLEESASLDRTFVDLYNCVDYTQCGTLQGELVDVQPCVQ